MKKFLLKLLVFTLILTAIFAPVNIFIDPYNIFHYDRPVDNGVEPNKNFIKTKYILHNRDKFDSLVFGSSRAGFIDVSAIPDGKYYDMCYSEGVPAEHVKTLKVLIRGGFVPKNVLVMVDDISCFVDPAMHENMLYRVPYPTGGPVSWLTFYAKYCDLITSFESLSVMKEYRESGKADPEFAERFRETGTERLDKPSEFDGTDGHGNEMPGYVAAYYKPRIEESIEDMRELAELCRENGIRLKVVTNPLYYKTYEAACEMGYLDFLYELAGVCDYVNFSGISNVTTTPGNYYETSHFTPYVSWAMVEIVYNGFEDEYLRDQGFGYPVNAQNRDEFLRLLKEQLAGNG
ncbi:MAG: hypothetical protein K6E16_00415 [Lachnospiraceae bacterium]|nr:hypothetical protein [Lachnospiraceae bacterium]